MDVKKVLALALLASLSACGSSLPALAGGCYPTQAAMQFVAARGVKYTLVRGPALQRIKVAAGRTKAVDFAAIIFQGETASVFFGNFAQVCGPYSMTKEQVFAFLRPA